MTAAGIEKTQRPKVGLYTFENKNNGQKFANFLMYCPIGVNTSAKAHALYNYRDLKTLHQHQDSLAIGS